MGIASDSDAPSPDKKGAKRKAGSKKGAGKAVEQGTGNDLGAQRIQRNRVPTKRARATPPPASETEDELEGESDLESDF